MISILSREASEAGALEGFSIVCAQCSGKIVATSSLAVMARSASAAHAAWHESRK